MKIFQVLGCVFVLESLFNWRIICVFLMIQGGICGRMLLCTFVTEIADCWRIGSIQRPNGLMLFFLFVQTVFCIWGWKCSQRLGLMDGISVLCNTAELIFHIWVVHGLQCINWLLEKFWRFLRLVLGLHDG